MYATKFTPFLVGKLDARERSAVSSFKEFMSGASILLDRPTIDQCCKNYASMPKDGFKSLLDSGDPSTIAHLIVGFGDFQFEGRSSLELLHNLGSCSRSGSAHILQSRDGDYHPWQMFAYASLAGVPPEAVIPQTGATFRTLAINSNVISLDGRGYEDLGHLLVAASFLVPDRGFEFRLDGQKVSLEWIAGKALEAHTNMRESVCHHFHITEGLVVASRLVPGLGGLSGEAQELIDRQIDILSYIGTVLTNLTNRKLISLREAEALIFPVGHALELAAISQMFGYQFSREQTNIINYIATASSFVFGQLMCMNDFHTLAHHRRAATLLLELDSIRSEGGCLAAADLTKYRVDLDAVGRPQVEFRHL